MARKDNVKGDHIVFQAGSMMVKFYQNNYPNIRGAWMNDDDEYYTEYEEVKMTAADRCQREEPNYFQTGRFLKRIVHEEWFEELRTDKRFTEKWRDKLVDDLLESKWKDLLGRTWEDRNRRETLKGHFVGTLIDAGVLSGGYDAIAKTMGYEEDYRSFSHYLGRGKRQPYFDWIVEYVNGQSCQK